MNGTGEQFRVWWQRVDRPPQSRIFATYRGANRLIARLDPRINPNDDLHYRCDESHEDCLTPVERVWVDRREVGQWEPYGVRAVAARRAR